MLARRVVDGLHAVAEVVHRIVGLRHRAVDRLVHALAPVVDRLRHLVYVGAQVAQLLDLLLVVNVDLDSAEEPLDVRHERVDVVQVLDTDGRQRVGDGRLRGLRQVDRLDDLGLDFLCHRDHPRMAESMPKPGILGLLLSLLCDRSAFSKYSSMSIPCVSESSVMAKK